MAAPRFASSIRKLSTFRAIPVRARRLRSPAQANPLEGIVPMVIGGRQLNRPETLVTLTLNEMKIENIPQFSFLGGDFLGGGRMDWYLPLYKIDLEFDGPHHSTTGGLARDAIRDVGVRNKGLRIVRLYYTDLFNLKARLAQIIGRKG